MSTYLGFEPTKSNDYYFVSYNNEDADRVGEITRALSGSGVNLWYDHGIDYGEDWETVITEKIGQAKAVILFFTKGILQKSHSYVQKEYKIATQFFNKKVYIVLMDEISKSEIPMEKIAWWMEINEKQCITGYSFVQTNTLVAAITGAIGAQRKIAPAPKRQTQTSAKKHRRVLPVILISIILAFLLLSCCVIGGIVGIAQVWNSTGNLESLFDKLSSQDSSSTADTEDTENLYLPDQDPEDYTGDFIYIPSDPADDETEQDNNTEQDYETEPDNEDEYYGDGDTEPDVPKYSLTTRCDSNFEIDCTGSSTPGNFTELKNHKYGAGETVTLTATANPGYNFEGWYDNWYGTLLSTDPTYVFTMPDYDVTISVRFSYYTVNIESNHPNGGTVTSMDYQKISIGETVTVNATPNEGYNFEGWYADRYGYGDDGLISKDPTYTFTMKDKNVELWAQFSYYTVTTGGYTYEGMAGTCTTYTDKKVSVGQTVTLTATVQNGYNFEGWYRGDICISESATYTFTMPAENVYYDAHYSKYTLTVEADTMEGTAGSVSNYQNKIVAVGDQVTLEATVNDGFNFDGWYIRGVRVSADLTYTYTMKKEDVWIEARFTYYTVTTGGYNYEGMAGSFTQYQDQKFSVGKEVTVTATTNNGYQFLGWYINGVCVSESTTYTFTMPNRNIVIDAMYQPQ